MRRVIVSKADPVINPRSTPDVCIEITGTLPDGWANLGEWDAYCDEQAEQIEGALILSLPGGIYDCLLRQMLLRKTTHFRVAHGVGETANG